jgi:hypothetical protein
MSELIDELVSGKLTPDQFSELVNKRAGGEDEALPPTSREVTGQLEKARLRIERAATKARLL